MKIIVYRNDEQKIGWVIPTSEWNGTDQELVEKVAGDRYFYVYYTASIISDLTFYNAWELNGNGIYVNIEKAKEIWKDKWREARKPILSSLDVEFMRAVESGDSKKQAEIAQKKQALRDVTLTPIPGTTPEEIKSVWPEVLNDPS